MALYTDPEPPLAEVEGSRGALVLEFGAPWCGHCQGAQTLIAEALPDGRGIRHLRIEDGRGKRLGRQFKVKLWPTLVFLRDGVEQARVVRPQNTVEIESALRTLTAPAAA